MLSSFPVLLPVPALRRRLSALRFILRQVIGSLTSNRPQPAGQHRGERNDNFQVVEVIQVKHSTTRPLLQRQSPISDVGGSFPL